MKIDGGRGVRGRQSRLLVVVDYFLELLSRANAYKIRDIGDIYFVKVLGIGVFLPYFFLPFFPPELQKGIHGNI